MKTLVLVRHAKAEASAPSGADADRPLSGLGRRDARVMAERLMDYQVAPDGLIASPAVRAVQTAEAFARTFSLEMHTEQRIYEADEERLLDVLRDVHDDFQTVIMVGHNPGFFDLLCRLTGRRYVKLPTCGVAVLQLPVRSWRKAGRRPAGLTTSFTPRKGPLKRPVDISGKLTLTDRFRMWRFNRPNRLMIAMVLLLAALLLALLIPLIMRSSINSAGVPQQGSMQ